MNGRDRRARRLEQSERDPEIFERITAEEVEVEIARLEAGEPGRIPEWRLDREIQLLKAEIAWFDAAPEDREEYPTW